MPDPNNWSETPNIRDEVQDLLADCLWYRVYDAVEALFSQVETSGGNDSAVEFADELNRFFRETGIGWELTHEGIAYRGEETFSMITRETATTLKDAQLKTAANELREAIQDISRRPHADLTGAVQHAMAALECVAREVTGERSATLGKLIDPLDLPKPLDGAVEKLWGFASNHARHISEGKELSHADAELVVAIACAISQHLISRSQAKTPND
jgi:hypothetical protein